MAGFDEISSGQPSQIGAEMRKRWKWAAPGTIIPFGHRNWAAPGLSASGFGAGFRLPRKSRRAPCHVLQTGKDSCQAGPNSGLHGPLPDCKAWQILTRSRACTGCLTPSFRCALRSGSQISSVNFFFNLCVSCVDNSSFSSVHKLFQPSLLPLPVMSSVQLQPWLCSTQFFRADLTLTH